MNVLTWNVRGYNSLEKQRIVKEVIRTYHTDIVMLQEMKIREEKLIKVAMKIWKQAQYIAIGSQGRLGGTWIMWNPITMEIQKISEGTNRELSVLVTTIGIGFHCFNKCVCTKFAV